MNRLSVQVLGFRILDDLAQIHHRDPVGDVADHAEVVGHEQIRQAELVLKFLEQIDDLRLHRHVECRHRFVGDDQFRVQGQRPGDTDALALPTGELMGEPVVVLRVEANPLEQLLNPPLQLGALGQPVQFQRIADDLAHPFARVQRRERILEDHLHLAAQRAQVAARPAHQLLTEESHRSRRRVRQLQDRPAQS